MISTDEKTEEIGTCPKICEKRGKVKSNKSDGAKRKCDVPEGKIPSILGYILYKIKPEDVRKILSDVGGFKTTTKRTIRIDELQRNSRNESGNDSDAKTGGGITGVTKAEKKS